MVIKKTVPKLFDTNTVYLIMLSYKRFKCRPGLTQKKKKYACVTIIGRHI